jgi:type IV secretory pathway VirB2 component (pilin)
MQLKPIIQGLAVVWLLLFVVSFISLQTTESDGSATSDLNRVVAFLTWQAAAFIVAALGAVATRFALPRGIAGIKLAGYLPLALSVFFVASFIALIGFRFYVAPLFE